MFRDDNSTPGGVKVVDPSLVVLVVLVTLVTFVALVTLVCSRMAVKVKAEVRVTRKWTLSHAHISRIIALKSLPRGDAVCMFQRRCLLPPAPTTFRKRVSFLTDVIFLRRAISCAVHEAKQVSSKEFASMDQTYYKNNCHGVSKVDYFVRSAFSILPAVAIAPTRSNTGYFGPSCTLQSVEPTGIELLACKFV